MSAQDAAVAATCQPKEQSLHMHKPNATKHQQSTSLACIMVDKKTDVEAQSLASDRTAASDQPRCLPPTQPSPYVNVADTRYNTQEGTSSTGTSTTALVDLEDELPVKKHHKIIRALRWTWLTIYHRLCLLVLLPNLVVMITLAAQHNLFKIPMPDLATAVAANTAAAILMRQELVINLLFILAGKCPRSAPLRIRRFLAKIYHFGGVHSGAGIAATVWFTLFNAALLWAWRTDAIPGLPKDEIPFVVVLTIIIDVLLISIVCFAHPSLRRKYHNTFEAVHRFAGWLAVILFWIHIIFFINMLEKPRVPQRPLGEALLQSPAIYLLILITICLVLPWLRLRRVPVQVEPLSSHASRWHFTYTNVSLCSAARLTDSPLKEWHSFAAIPEPSGRGFSLIVSNAGDWTSRMIKSPPTHLWTRGIPTRGVLHIASIFNKIVLVATGSGIGPVLSLLSARNIPCRILWSARSPIHTYRAGIMDEVFEADPAAMVYDTKAVGKEQRPDLLRLSWGLYRESGAEAVFVISNQKVTEKLVYGLESRGVPAFAPIFDS